MSNDIPTTDANASTGEYKTTHNGEVVAKGIAPEVASGLREQLAALAHEQWSGWMRYMFGDCESTVCPAVAGLLRPDGETPKPRIDHREYRQRWVRQMNTPYAQLTPQEQKSDQAEADQVLALLAAQRADPPRTGASEPKEWRHAYEAARAVVIELCEGKRRWVMSVPARPDHDPDLIIGSALCTMRDEIETLESELLRLVGPICPHDGKRARECGNRYSFGDGSSAVIWKQPGHPDWPEGAEWLRNAR